MTVAIVTFVILAVFFGICLIDNDLIEGDRPGLKAIIYIIVIILSMLFGVLVQYSIIGGSYNSKKYLIDSEIRKTIVDDVVMQSDTVYIITRKPNT
jgi:hypothetical protein